MDPKPFVTTSLSRKLRVALRDKFLGGMVHDTNTDANTNDTNPQFNFRSQNECYACRLQSRFYCNNNCRSDVNPNTLNTGIVRIQLLLAASAGLGGGSDGS